MSKCIYCIQTLDPDDAKLKPSDEHIIPYALGGSLDCATKDVCTQCNSTLGTSVDGDFINSPIIAMKRQIYRTPGYKGTIPAIKGSAGSEGSDWEGKIALTVDNPPVVKVTPKVIEDEGDGSFDVIGTEEEVRKITAGLVRKHVLTPEATDGEIQAEVDRLIAAGSKTEHAQIQTRMSVDFTAVHRGLIKIAYGFSHLLFGLKWSESKMAEPLRMIASGEGSAEEVRSSIKICTAFDVRDLLPLPVETKESGHHVLALIFSPKPIVIVSLFGDPVLTVCVEVSIDAESLQSLEEGDKLMVTVDPTNRTTVWFGREAFKR